MWKYRNTNAMTLVICHSVLVLALTMLFAIGFSTSVQAICASPTDFSGKWNSTWSSSTGPYRSRLDIKLNASGFEGTFANGKFFGYYIAGNKKLARGHWFRTQGDSGGPCPYGRFYFSLIKGNIQGKWNYCAKPPRWSWNAIHECDDHHLDPVEE